MTGVHVISLPEPELGADAVRSAYALFRSMDDVRPSAKLLTEPDGSAKAEHSLAHGDIVVMLYLAPHRVAGVGNVCPYSSPGCRAGCLFTAGRAAFDAGINRARVCRTRFMVAYPQAFSTVLAHEVGRYVRSYGPRVAVRLNGTSDIPWERAAPWLFSRFSGTQFYDYTKWPIGSRVLPANYDLTYSVSERPVVLDELGPRVAVVFSTRRGESLPAWHGRLPVIDGDVTDARFLEPTGVVVGLRAKGAMRSDTSGMVRSAVQ